MSLVKEKSSLPKVFRGARYKMDNPSRGTVLIFNNKKYPKKLGVEDRKFSDIDAANLMSALKCVRYKDVRLKNNLEAAEIKAAIEQVALADHSESDSVVVVFLAYGEHNLVFCKDRVVGIQILLDPLKGDVCHKSLVGKPKIIILQTCNPLMKVMANDGDEDKDKVVVKHVIPTEADFLYLGSEVPGLITERPLFKGSIFIDHLSKNIKTNGTNLEICKLMTRTMQNVVEEMDNWQADWATLNDAMMPFMASLLTKELYFT